MTECLEKYGFKSTFIRWIQTMYTDIKGCILNNGWVSAPFKVFRGIRQVYPASALIFVLAVEIMAIKLRETKHIRGIEIKLNSIVRIHLMNELLKPNFSRHSVINDHSKESNAFVKSRNNMAPSMLNFSE
jgi:hypothetical protein